MTWLEALRKETQKPKMSQAQIARDMKVSGATISLVLKGKYPGDMDRIETIVRGKYMHETVMCPILSEIALDRCLEEQVKPFSSHNPTRAQLFKACRTCKHNKKK